jgi:alkyl hydroperoxide reductase subunit AhpC
MKGFAEKYAQEGMNIVSISTDKDRSAWIKALEEEQMPWANLLDETGISKSYGVAGIPSVYLIDVNGKVIFEKLYGENIEHELKKVFGH